MNILLTNDDGYDSTGITILKKCLSKYGTVVIVAPDSPRSGASASLTLGKEIFVEQVSRDTFKCSGTPIDCVSFGLSSLNIKFDIVVSGCNHGWNISYDTMYSGTIGGCLEAMMFFKPAIAFSTHDDFEAVEKYFDKVWDFIHQNKLVNSKHILNINFPDSEVKDIALGRLYFRHDTNYFERNPITGGYYPLRHCEEDFSEIDTDCYQVKHGIISIVPLNRTYFDKSLFLKLKKNIEKK